MFSGLRHMINAFTVQWWWTFPPETGFLFCHSHHFSWMFSWVCLGRGCLNPKTWQRTLKTLLLCVGWLETGKNRVLTENHSCEDHHEVEASLGCRVRLWFLKTKQNNNNKRKQRNPQNFFVFTKASVVEKEALIANPQYLINTSPYLLDV